MRWKLDQDIVFCKALSSWKIRCLVFVRCFASTIRLLAPRPSTATCSESMMWGEIALCTIFWKASLCNLGLRPRLAFGFARDAANSVGVRHSLYPWAASSLESTSRRATAPSKSCTLMVGTIGLPKISQATNELPTLGVLQLKVRFFFLKESSHCFKQIVEVLRRSNEWWNVLDEVLRHLFLPSCSEWTPWLLGTSRHLVKRMGMGQCSVLAVCAYGALTFRLRFSYGTDS